LNMKFPLLQRHFTGLSTHFRCATSIVMASSVDEKLLKATKFPPEFNQKVDMQKVNVEVMKKLV
jgi:hypothetical protein